MKRYIIFIFIASLLFTACNPNKDVYDTLDETYDVPYNEVGGTYLLTGDDYEAASKAALLVAVDKTDSTWATTIKTYHSFNDKFTANEFVPALIATNFPALKDGSNMVVSFNQFVGELYGDVQSSELEDVDYTTIGGTTADTLCFVESDVPNDYLPDYLSAKYPNAEKDTYAEVFYRFPDYNTTAGSFYMFDGTTWTTVDNSLVLLTADYDSMGEGSGQPGKYNNFSSSTPPQNYLPQFLSMKFPYAQAGDQKLIVSHYYNGTTVPYVITNEYDGTNWNTYFPGLKMNSQFIYQDKSWKFDPTVRHTMTSSDYQLIADEEGEYINTYGTGGYYYGADAHYNNFDIRLTKRRTYAPALFPASMSDADGMDLIWSNLKEGVVIFLQKKYPDAVPSVDGIDVHYFITFDSFNDDFQHIIYTIEYKCAAAGAIPSFELVTDALPVE